MLELHAIIKFQKYSFSKAYLLSCVWACMHMCMPVYVRECAPVSLYVCRSPQQPEWNNGTPEFRALGGFKPSLVLGIEPNWSLIEYLTELRKNSTADASFQSHQFHFYFHNLHYLSKH